MRDFEKFNFLFDKTIIELLVLVATIAVVLVIQLINTRQVEKSILKINEEISKIQKYSEVQGTHIAQFNGHFGLIDQKLKKLEEIASITSRDIASMAEGITGEVGVGKAIELARRGASVDEILENSNLRKDQAELIVKFHGS
jgi:hypothetical protein